jgi:hypothetical protein
MKIYRFIIILLILISFNLVSNLNAQILDELDETIYQTDIVEVKYEKKSAAKAMLLSAIFPGAGQFYVNKKSITAYIFPVIEIGLWVAFLNYDNKGDDVTKKYKDYANLHYTRSRQHEAEAHLLEFLSTYPGNTYATGHFRLDDHNTQHFYEDIGKYNKYIFGWEDWYNNFFRDPTTNELRVQWIISGEDTGDPTNIKWVANKRISDGQVISPANGSQLRDQYNVMRKNAENHYTNRRTMNYLILMNHAIAIFDANRVTKKYNRNYIKTTSIQPRLNTALINNKITPLLSFNLDF